MKNSSPDRIQTSSLLVMYEPIPEAEFRDVLAGLKPCWGSLVLAGATVRRDNEWVPAAMQIWVDDGPPQPVEIHHHPEVPPSLQLFRWASPTVTALDILNRIIERGSVRIGSMQISFENFRFERAAFISSSNNGLLNPDLGRRVTGRPKVFFEGRFEDGGWIQEQYVALEEELKQPNYLYHTLSNAVRHLAGFSTGSSHFAGHLQGALSLPIDLQANVVRRQVNFSVNIPLALERLPLEVRYVARSRLGERDVRLTVPEPTKSNCNVVYSSTASLSEGDEALGLSLLIGGRRMESVFLEPAPLPKESDRQNDGDSHQKAKGRTAPEKRGRKRKIPLIEQIQEAYANFNNMDWLQGCQLTRLQAVEERVKPAQTLPEGRALLEMLEEAALMAADSLSDFSRKTKEVVFLRSFVQGMRVKDIAV